MVDDLLKPTPGEYITWLNPPASYGTKPPCKDLMVSEGW